MPRQRSIPAAKTTPDVAIEQAMSDVASGERLASIEIFPDRVGKPKTVAPVTGSDPVVVTVVEGAPVSRTFDLPPKLVRKLEEALLEERDQRTIKLTRNAIAIEALRLWLKKHNYPSDC